MGDKGRNEVNEEGSKEKDVNIFHCNEISAAASVCLSPNQITEGKYHNATYIAVDIIGENGSGEGRRKGEERERVVQHHAQHIVVQL